MIPSGIDLAKVRAAAGRADVAPEYVAESDALVVGNARMLYEQKAQDILLEAAAR